MATYKLKTIIELRDIAPTKDDLVFCTELENYFQLKIPSALVVDDIAVIDASKFENGQFIRVSDSGAGGGGGETNTSSNSGVGEGLALAKVGVDLPFKSIKAGTNMSLIADADSLTLNAIGGGGGLSDTEEFIFKPTGIASGNVYTDFFLLADAVETSTKIIKTVYVDMTGFKTVYTKVGDRAFTNWKNVTVKALSGLTLSPILEFDGEITFTTFPTTFIDLTIRFRNTVAPVQSLIVGSFVALNLINSKIENRTIGGTVPTKAILALDQVNDGVFLNMNNSSINGIDYEVISGTVGNLIAVLTNSSIFGQNTFRGSWVGSILTSIDSIVNKVQTNWTGALQYDGRIDIREGDLDEHFDLSANLSGKLVARKNINSGIAPTVNDDKSLGFLVFSEWIDSNLNKVYKCIDNAVGAAVWVILN